MRLNTEDNTLLRSSSIFSFTSDHRKLERGCENRRNLAARMHFISRILCTFVNCFVVRCITVHEIQIELWQAGGLYVVSMFGFMSSFVASVVYLQMSL